MLNLSAALGRLVLSGREMARLSGFSLRVTGLIDVIDDVNRGVHKKRGIGSRNRQQASAAGDSSAQGNNNSTKLVLSNTRLTDSAAAAAATVEAEVRIQRTESLKVNEPRNASVGGVNLATEHTPQWTTKPARKLLGVMGVPMHTPREPILTTPPVSLSTAVGDTSAITKLIGQSLNGHDSEPAFVGAGGIAAERQTDNGTMTSGHPELAPEIGVGKGATAGRWGGQGLEGNREMDGEGAVIGGGELSRSGGASRRGLVEGKGEAGLAGGGRLSRSGSVVVKEGKLIEFQDVPLVTPAGEVLIEALSFKVRTLQRSGVEDFFFFHIYIFSCVDGIGCRPHI